MIFQNNTNTDKLEQLTQPQLTQYIFNTGAELITIDNELVFARDFGDINYKLLPWLARQRYVTGSISSKKSEDFSAEPKTSEFLVTENPYLLWQNISHQKITEINKDFHF